MALIRPCADLRNNYNEISKICHETNEPMYITRNGSNDLVVLSDEAYEILKNKFEQTEEEKINSIVSKKFDEQFSTFEEFQKDVFKKIDKALKEIKEGKSRDLSDFTKEMEAKYGL